MKPIERDEVAGLAWLFGAAAECSVRWGWDEETFIRLARACFRQERDGVLPADVSDPAVTVEPPP